MSRVRPAASRVVDTALGPVECELTGGAGPVVLGVHGGAGGLDQARLLLDWLDPDRYRKLALSRPGYPGTPLAGREGPERQADLLAALLDALGVERAAVVALSSGGPSGYLLAARHPARVAALVAISAVTGPHAPPDTAGPVAQAVLTSRVGRVVVRATARAKPAWLLRGVLHGESTLGEADIRRHVDHAMADPATLDWLRAFLDAVYPYRPRRAGTDNDTAQLRDLAALPLRDIRCPSLVVHGTHDADVPFEHARLATDRIAGAEHHWLDRGSHLGFWLHPEAGRAQAAARTFLDRHYPW